MSGARVVYEPDEYLEFLGTARHEEMKVWLAANGIDPADVTVRAPISVGPLTPGDSPTIRYTTHLRTAEGHKYLDEATGEAAQEERTVPLLVDPPPQWRTEKETSACQSSP